MQAVIQVVNFLMLFLILVGTFLFQVGLLSELAAQFKPFLFAALAYLAALLAYGGVKMVSMRKAERRPVPGWMWWSTMCSFFVSLFHWSVKRCCHGPLGCA